MQTLISQLPLSHLSGNVTLGSQLESMRLEIKGFDTGGSIFASPTH